MEMLLRILAGTAAIGAAAVISGRANKRAAKSNREMANREPETETSKSGADVSKHEIDNRAETVGKKKTRTKKVTAPSKASSKRQSKPVAKPTAKKSTSTRKSAARKAAPKRKAS